MSIELDIMVVSDHHMGDGSGSDDFTYAEYRKLRRKEDMYIDFIRRHNPKILIINGDSFELWQSKLKRILKVYRRTIAFYKELIAAGCEVIVIPGNHDNSIRLRRYAKLLDGIPIANNYQLYHKTSTNSSIHMFFSHGHGNDKIMDSKLTKFGVYVLGLVERILPGIDNVALMIRDKFITQSAVEEKTAQNADSILKKYPSIDYVFHGHTHSLGIFGRYIDSGTCMGDKLQAVGIVDDAVFLINGKTKLDFAFLTERDD